VMTSAPDTSLPSGALQKDSRQGQTLQRSRASAQYGAGHTLTVLHQSISHDLGHQRVRVAGALTAIEHQRRSLWLVDFSPSGANISICRLSDVHGHGSRIVRNWW
jgi:hypothetical protein